MAMVNDVDTADTAVEVKAAAAADETDMDSVVVEVDLG